MENSSKKNITQILQAWRNGDPQALNELLPIVYDELHRIASAYMRHERPNHTLQPTDLIDEAYLRLVNQWETTWQNRAHFFGVASNVMRRFLIDYAKKRSAQKRGGGNEQLVLDETLMWKPERDAELIKLDQALSKFEGIDPKKSKVVELRFFVGLSIQETASMLKVSPSTVKRDFESARAWLHRELRGR